MEAFKSNNKKNPEENFSRGPYAPEGSGGMLGYDSFVSIKDALTSSNIDSVMARKVSSIIESWLKDPSKVEPFMAMRDVLETVRKIPPGDERIKLMNTIVRTLGQPGTLATYLDMLRDAATRYGTAEYQLCRDKLRAVKMHSIYGWCGNTLLVESFEEPTDGTYKSDPELGRKLGNAPSAWNLTMHIWQPNLTAKGFPVNSVLEEGSILEPPHSHPFNFVSTVVKGSMHQSIYKQKYTEVAESIKNNENGLGYYDQEVLEHVDGVWPPHDFHETCRLKTLEHRVLLKEGDSYYMPCDRIHDVEIDGKMAVSRPAVSLFLSSEYLVMPHVYMTKSMASFHSQNPNIKHTGSPISEEAWHNKLKAISAYLRGETKTLNLNEIINHKGEYAFFNVYNR